MYATKFHVHKFFIPPTCLFMFLMILTTASPPLNNIASLFFIIDELALCEV
jgi:hypothetical protein